ncbi:MAG: hypothetical protein ABSF99_02325 [Anaerolineales bacterium]
MFAITCAISSPVRVQNLLKNREQRRRGEYNGGSPGFRPNGHGDSARASSPAGAAMYPPGSSHKVDRLTG